jgi:hypothetical protein
MALERELISTPVNIAIALAERSFPTVTMWNRLEGRPRTIDFDKAMKAEVRDALWMLTKQWQMGEFVANDAGSPINAKAHIHTSKITQYQAASNPFQEFDQFLPLEAQAEQKKIPFVRGQEIISIDVRLHLGKYWIKLLQSKSLSYAADYITKYAFVLPAKTRATDYIYSQKNTLQTYKAISGRSMDGYLLLAYLLTGGSAADGITNTDPDKTTLNNLGKEFVTWYQKTYLQPLQTEDNAWLPNQLEYNFTCNAEAPDASKLLVAQEYYDGYLDWYAFNTQRSTPSNKGIIKDETDSLIPAHIVFDGMPDTRWWKFEDSKTSLGDVKPSTTDLSKLLLIEFGLVFANDWFLIPFELPIGSIASIKGLTVSNNFGETYWIEAVEKSNTSKNEWSMYKMQTNTTKADDALVLTPTAIKVQESKPLEEVLFIRDEVANMVWGIETKVPSNEGAGVNGNERALQIRQYHEAIVKAAIVGVPPVVPVNDAKVSYLPMTDVPENWIPFVPVKLADPFRTREIQLQRGSLLRIIEGDTEEATKIKPVTSILREGLENLPTALPYYIHEEEIPRSGIRVTQNYQRTRWINGEVLVWMGMKKKTGKGEGSSNLAFDQLKDVK